MKTYTADAELARLLKTASQTGERLLVKAGDECYELNVNPAAEVDDIWAGYDPDKLRAVVLQDASLESGTPREELDAIIADIRAQRGQAPRPWER